MLDRDSRLARAVSYALFSVRVVVISSQIHNLVVTLRDADLPGQLKHHLIELIGNCASWGDLAKTCGIVALEAAKAIGVFAWENPTWALVDFWIIHDIILAKKAFPWSK